VWEAELWKGDPSGSKEKKCVVSTSRVTLLCNLPVPEHAKNAADNLRKYAKL